MAEIQVTWLTEKGEVERGGEDALRRFARPCWIDVVAPTQDTLTQLASVVGTHPLIESAVLHGTHRAKLFSLPEGHLISWLAPSGFTEDRVTSNQISLIVQDDLIVTFHQDEPLALKPSDVTSKVFSHGIDKIAHAILSAELDRVFPLIESVGDKLFEIEDEIMINPTTEQLNKLLDYKWQLVGLHRILSPEQNVIHSLTRIRTMQDSDTFVYYQDLTYLISTLLDSVETYQDVAASVMDVHLSAQSNNMNKIMGQLTVVATIFMPLTLLSGIYGMNLTVGMWPPIDAVWSFWVIVGLMLIIALAMGVYFKRQKWW